MDLQDIVFARRAPLVAGKLLFKQTNVNLSQKMPDDQVEQYFADNKLSLEQENSSK